jgi:hypothetical protein
MGVRQRDDGLGNDVCERDSGGGTGYYTIAHEDAFDVSVELELNVLLPKIAPVKTDWLGITRSREKRPKSVPVEVRIREVAAM